MGQIQDIVRLPRPGEGQLGGLVDRGMDYDPAFGSHNNSFTEGVKPNSAINDRHFGGIITQDNPGLFIHPGLAQIGESRDPVGCPKQHRGKGDGINPGVQQRPAP